MANQKYENLLNMALETSEPERNKSLNLNVGFDVATDSWDVIVKYNGNLRQSIANISTDIVVTELLGGYAVIKVRDDLLDKVSRIDEIEFMEMPKRLYFSIDSVRSISCVNSVQVPPLNLSGAGTCFALIDSGIDYRHPDFCNEDGSSRILYLWDQTLSGNPPVGYNIGTEYTNEQINEAINGERTIDSIDVSGHGTAVAGIAVSNGRASGGRYKGAAFNASIIVVKLGVPGTSLFPRTTEIMLAIDYAIKKSVELDIPMAINLSFGNNYGSHDGTSLLETYIDNVSGSFRGVICVGTGNEGAMAGHYMANVSTGQTVRTEFVVGQYETTLNIQIWKNYADNLAFRLVSPGGTVINFFQNNITQTFNLGNTKVLIYYGEPKPYTVNQEIYIDMIPIGEYIEDGVWYIETRGINSIYGRIDMWLPSSESIGKDTGFLQPSPENTQTIPSTSRKVITVAAYNQATDSYADFSGRGVEASRSIFKKPDIAAPGVSITTTGEGGGYVVVSGTSFATPLVCGCACLMMEYGIVNDNDRFLYGEKIKAYLMRGARKLPGYEQWPNSLLGWGAVCLENSIIT